MSQERYKRLRLDKFENDEDNYQEHELAGTSYCQNILLAGMSNKIEQLEAKVDLLTETNDNLTNYIETLQTTCIKCDQARVIESKYKAKFIEKLSEKRNDKTWRSMIKKLQIEQVKEDTLVEVKSLFLSGSEQPVPFVRKLAEILFGPRKLLVTLMGKDGKPLKGIKACDRNEFFKPSEEQLILDLVKLIDEELFEDEDAFEYLVRKNVNQLGRDLAKGHIRLPPRCLHFNRSTNRTITDYFQKIRRPEQTSRNAQCD